MGSLSLLQQIFQTQELNQAVLHCRRILYQLSYEGSPQETSGKTLNAPIFTLWGFQKENRERSQNDVQVSDLGIDEIVMLLK